MPYIRISLAKKLTDEQQAEVVQGLGEALENIPGKDRRGLIVDMEDGKTLFVGSMRQDNFAFVDARYYSNFEYHLKKKYTVAVFDALNRILGIPKERMFMTITEYNSWGGFGDFKDEYYEDE